ncbi:type I-E CRISPR-associated protein Cse2/CasB [Streptomyces sp. NPDC059096]|uniref:type I-E CRISPR-associated protein Cse2/CasB n=1 Tax=Streptomyces sp. NPDC059096 TaxID=3346727 RepID=UPI0036BAAA54
MTTAAPPDDPAAAHRERLTNFTSRIERICRDDPGARSALRSGLRRGIDDVRVQPMHRLVAAWIPDSLSGAQQLPYYAVASMIAAQPRSAFTDIDADDENATETAAPSQTTKAAEVPGPRAAEAVGEADSGRGGGPADGGSGADGALSTGAAKKSPGRYGSSLGTAFAKAVTTGPDRDRAMRDSTAEDRLNLLTRQSAQGLHRHLPSSVGYLRELDVPVDWAQLLSDLIAWPRHSGAIARRWLQDYYRLREQEARKQADEDDQREQEQPPETS